MIRPVSLTLAVLLSGSGTAWAQSDFSGTWEVAVREFGQKNFYLPMIDGRLTIEQRDDRYVAAYDRKPMFSGRLENGELHLNCEDGGKPCGAFILHRSGSRLTGSGTLQEITVTLEGKRPVARPNTATVHAFNPQNFYTFF